MIAIDAGAPSLLASPAEKPLRGDMSDATQLISAIQQGDDNAARNLLALVYDELRRLAAFKMAQEAPGQTLQATALVHEAWLKLIGDRNPTFNNRAHFFRAAGEAMRRILIDQARRKQAQRHGGRLERVELDGLEIAAQGDDEQLFKVNEALDKLSADYPLQAEVVKLRYFAGMSNEEIAQALDISVSSVKNYWVFARAWLFNVIDES